MISLSMIVTLSICHNIRLSLSQVGNQRKRRARSAVRRSRNVVDLVDGSGVSNDDDEGNEVIVRIGVEEEEASSATDEGTVLGKYRVIHTISD